jgi:adenosine deaminase
MTYTLGYDDFKQMVRTSLEHSFLPGESLWQQPGPFESYALARAACRAQPGREQATGACATLLAGSEKARQQFELERRFHAFEATF